MLSSSILEQFRKPVNFCNSGARKCITFSIAFGTKQTRRFEALETQKNQVHQISV